MGYQMPILSSTGMLHTVHLHIHEHINMITYMKNKGTKLHHVNFNQTEGNDHPPLMFLQTSATDGGGLIYSLCLWLQSPLFKTSWGSAHLENPQGTLHFLPPLSPPPDWAMALTPLCLYAAAFLSTVRQVKALSYLFSCTSLCKCKQKCS